MPESSDIVRKLPDSGLSPPCLLQIKVLDMLNQERAAAERKNMIYKIERRVAQSREEALMTQVSVPTYCQHWTSFYAGNTFVMFTCVTFITGRE